MCYVKIGDSYFNPMQIDRIKPETVPVGGKHKPVVKVYTKGWALSFDAIDLGLNVPACDLELEALGVADAMAAKVVADVNEALK